MDRRREAAQVFGKAILIAGLTAMSPLSAFAAEFNGYGVVTTDYVYRGVTYSDGHIAGQLGGDLEFANGIYFGAWGSTVDIQNGPTRQRDYQLNYYLGYLFDVNNRWSFGANIVAYTFPGQEGDVDYNYEEVTLSASYRDFLWLEYSWSPDLFDTGYDSQNIELLFEWPMPWDMVFGAAGGYYDTSELTGSGYGYWQLGVTKPIGIVDIDLRYHDTNRWVFIISSEERAESRLSLSARIHF